MNEPIFSAVEIEINHACNRACSYCPNAVASRIHQGEMDPSLLIQVLGELRSIDFSGRVSFDFYNEPLIHSDFEGVVQMTRAQLERASIVVYTNGTRLPVDRFRRLLALGVDRFIVTRHEADRLHLFEKTFSLLTNDEKSCVVYRDHKDIRLTNRGGMLPHLGESGLPLTPCQIPEQIITLTVNGNVLPCFEDFHEKLVMGNLRDQSLLEIWKSTKYREFRKSLRMGLRHLYEPCKSCNRIEVLPPPMETPHGI